MSVDSFIQQRISLDTSSASEHSSAATSSHRLPFRNPQSSNASALRAVTGPGGGEPAVDPRWQMALPGGADAQHAFFRSIESELPEADRIAIHHGSAASPTPAQGGQQQSPLQPQQEVGTSKRHSILRGKPKQVTKLPIGPGGGGGLSNASASTLASVSSTGYGDLGRAASTSISSTRRPATSSAGISLPSSSSSTNLASTSMSSTTAAARRVNAPGPINVINARTRTYSLGGSNGTNNANVPPATPPAGANTHQPQPPLRLATGDGLTFIQGESDAQEDTSEYCIAIIGSKGCGKTMLIRKVIKRYTIVDTRTFTVGDVVGKCRSLFVHLSYTWFYLRFWIC